MESDPERIVREWNREIEAEMRRRAARQADGPWKIVDGTPRPKGGATDRPSRKRWPKARTIGSGK